MSKEVKVCCAGGLEWKLNVEPARNQEAGFARLNMWYATPTDETLREFQSHRVTVDSPKLPFMARIQARLDGGASVSNVRTQIDLYGTYSAVDTQEERAAWNCLREMCTDALCSFNLTDRNVPPCVFKRNE